MPRFSSAILISTHTPAWGVTATGSSPVIRTKNFNSHARVGRDLNDSRQIRLDSHFNSHARVGRDWKSGSN